MSQIETQEHDDTDRYTPRARYTYEINRVSCEGKKITFGFDAEFTTKQKANEYLTNYSVGAEVTGYYNPENPGEAVLIRSARKTAVGLIISIVMLTFMLISACAVGVGVVLQLANYAQLFHRCFMSCKATTSA